MQDHSQTPAIYLSYAWGGKSQSLAEAIESEFHGRGIPIIRDQQNLKYKGLIKNFMKTLGRGKYIIVVLSDKYLRSENCMFELLQIFDNHDFYDRIFPVVLDEINISKAADRVEYVRYWENETENLDQQIRKLKGLANLQGVTDDLNLYTEIRNNIANLTNILKDINTLSEEQHIQSNFEQLFTRIDEKIKSDHQRKRNGKKIPWMKLALIGAAIVGAFWLSFQLLVLTKPHDNSAMDSLTSVPPVGDSLVLKDTLVRNPRPLSDPSGEGDTNGETEFYQVDLLVPSNMINATIFVDGSVADVLSRDLTFITLRVKEKTNSHHFEITNGADTCATVKLITENNVELTLCD